MKINFKSEKFIQEMKKTRKFAKTFCEKNEYHPNPIIEENERIYVGLTRNKIIYGKRYCPCFMVVGETIEEREGKKNRICPCEPAIEEEIPTQGKCHCGIFCTKEFITQFNLKKEVQETESLKQNMKTLLNKKEINGRELEYLLEQRKNKKIEFLLIDVREQLEYEEKRIVGVDYLIPTSSFYKEIEKIKEHKEKYIVIHCHSGGRSFQTQQILEKKGYKKTINLLGGISNFQGEKI